MQINRIARQYNLPGKFLSFPGSGARFQRQIEVYRKHGLLWLLQRGFGARTFRGAAEFDEKFNGIRDFAQSVDSSLIFFGFTQTQERQNIIFDRIKLKGSRLKFARDLERMRIIYEITGFELTTDEIRSLIDENKTSPRKRPLRKAIGKLLTKTSKECRDKLRSIYIAIGVSGLKFEALLSLNNHNLAINVLNMEKGRFRERYRMYQKGLDLEYVDPAGNNVKEHFKFTETPGMLDVILTHPTKTIRERLIDLRRQGIRDITASRLGQSYHKKPLSPALNLCMAGNSAILRGDLKAAIDHFRKAIVTAAERKDHKIENSARKSLKCAELLQKAAVHKRKQKPGEAIDTYEQAIRVLGEKAAKSTVHIHIAEEAINCMGDLESESFRSLIRKSFGIKSTSEIPSPEIIGPEIKLDLAIRALEYINNNYCRNEATNFPAIFALYCVLDKKLRLKTFPGVQEKAENILEDLYKKGIISFGPQNIPDYLKAQYSLLRLCFTICLYIVAERPVSAARLKYYWKPGVTLKHLAESRYRDLKKRFR